MLASICLTQPIAFTAARLVAKRILLIPVDDKVFAFDLVQCKFLGALCPPAVGENAHKYGMVTLVYPLLDNQGDLESIMLSFECGHLCEYSIKEWQSFNDDFNQSLDILLNSTQNDVPLMYEQYGYDQAQITVLLPFNTIETVAGSIVLSMDRIDKDRLICTGAFNSVWIVDKAKGKIIKTVPCRNRSETVTIRQMDGRVAAVGCWNGSVRFYAISRKDDTADECEELGKISHGNYQIRRCKFHGKRLIVAAENGIISMCEP